MRARQRRGELKPDDFSFHYGGRMHDGKLVENCGRSNTPLTGRNPPSSASSSTASPISSANDVELSAKLIRLAASELGVEDGAPMLPRNGDDRIQTPDALARAAVEHFLPCGRIVEPSAGNGAFLRALPKGADWYEIQNGRDFLKAEGRWDWAVGNPPFSQFRAFLQKAMQVADNLVFIGLAPAWFVRARQEDMRQARFALVELCALPIPPTWPQLGIELTAGWGRAQAGRAAPPTRAGSALRRPPSPTLGPRRLPNQQSTNLRFDPAHGSAIRAT